VVARHLRIQVVLEVVRESEQQARDDRPSERARDGLGRVAVVAVRQPDGQQREQPARERIQNDPREHGRGVGEQQRAHRDPGRREDCFEQQEPPLARMRRGAGVRPEPEARQEHRSLEQRPREGPVGDEALWIVGAGEDAVVLRMGRAVDVAALEHEHRQRQQREVAAPSPEPERAVDEVVRRRNHAQK
jgi:hypothetical protein